MWIARRVALCLPLWLLLVSPAYANPVHLRCEYVENPLGIDVAKPRLSWQSDNRERNWKQSGYELLVATTPAKLGPGKADVWDSGKQAGAQSVGLVYGGPKLESRRRYYWTVRVWDAGGKESRWAAPAWWEMGLLDQADWKAQWITWKNPEAEADRSAMRWIWAPGVDALKAAPKSKAVFQLHFEVGAKPKSAALFVLARGDLQASVDGHVMGAKQTWHEFDREDIAGQLVPGQNTIEVMVTVEKPSDFGPDAGSSPKGALAALLKITGQDGTITRVGSDANWVARQDSAVTWQSAAVVGQLGDREFGEVPPLPQPAALFRRDFAVKKEVRSARLYVTALGSYRVFVDGQRAGDDVLTPDFADYRKRVLYQTYDVTSLIRRGGNTLGAMLGDGWFGSGLTWAGQPFLFLPPPTRLLAQLELEYKDGTRETVASDGQWKAAQSAILRSEIYAGEVYDARQEQPGWDKPGFDDAGWQAAAVGEAPTTPVVSQISAPVHIIDAITPKAVKRLANGDYVFDMGQNMVGWVKLKVNGPAGTAVRMRFAEILNPDGAIYTENLRDADATDLYSLRGEGMETFTPHFTFHGFRYVELSGYPGVPTVDSVTGEVASSVGTSPSGRLTTSSELVNRMWSIGLWGQRGNYLSVPTDCPQRDERLGWMGDAGVFWRTGSYNFDVAAFSQKWVNDVTDAQTTDGAFTNVSPDVIRPYMSEGAPGWGDAGVIVPWTTWLQYGDAEVIERSWDAMQRWMNFIQSRNPDFLRKNGVGPNFSDWLAPDERTSKELVATAYWALIAHMMSQMGHAIGKEQEAQAYDALYNHIRAAFQKEYVAADGKVGAGTQTSYVLALYVGLAPPALEAAMVNSLVADIQSRGGHLSTGFLGTPFLLFTLANHGRADIAYQLLLTETYPSWGYMLSKGATTWWERWNGDSGDPSMNSFNHYAFGSVVSWVYRSVAGIDTSIDHPGFQEIVIHPLLDSRVTHARGEYDSVYGGIVSDWTGTAAGPFKLDVVIPANTTASVYLPMIANRQVTESGKAVQAANENGSQVVRVGSGTYHFEVK